MAVTYGFYDAINGDRTYTAEEMGSIFDGIINNGVLPDYESALAVGASSPAAMNVTVAPGRAWFDHTWTHNDDTITLDVARSNASYPRIDIVVVETNKSTRTNSIKVVTGTAASNPVAPTPESTATVKQYVLAEVRVNTGATSITAANITDKRGSADCPFASIVEHLEGRMVTSFNGQTGAITYTPPVDSSLSSSSTNPLQNKVVNTELGKKENTSNKVTSITSARTDTQYPSAKAVYTAVSARELSSNKVTSLSASSTNVQYPGAKLVYDQLALKANLASPTFTGTPKAPTAAAGTSTTQIATTAFVQKQTSLYDGLAPSVGDVIFNRTTMTTEALALPFFRQDKVNASFPMGFGETHYTIGTSDYNTGWSFIFRYRNCAGHKIKITWHTNKTVTNTGTGTTTNKGLYFHWNTACYHTMLPASIWNSGYPLNVGNSVALEWEDLCGSSTYNESSDSYSYTYGSVVANAARTNLFTIPSNVYSESWLYGKLSISAPTSQSIGDDRYIGVYIDKIEIVN